MRNREGLRQFIAVFIWMALLLVALHALSGCASTKANLETTEDRQLTIAQALTALAATIDSTVSAADHAFDQGHIEFREACKVEQYGYLAHAIVKQALVALEVEDEAGAAAYLEAARAALVGLTEEAKLLVEDNCAGNPERVNYEKAFLLFAVL